MKVLVTGSDGYIGVILTQMLQDKGFEVVGLDTGFYRSGWLYNTVKPSPLTITKDTRNITVKDLRGFDAIVHLAELSNDPLGENDTRLTYKINHLGTASLIKKAKLAKVKKFIYFSSCSVYGTSNHTVTEESKTNPLTEYARCKLLNEKLLIKLASVNFCPVILRNATVFGISPRMRFDLVVNNLSAVAWTTKEVKMQSDGTPWRPLVHVTDVANAVICALLAPQKTVQNQIFNVGAPNANYQIKNIAELIAKAISTSKITFGKNGGDKRDYRVNFDKINSKLPGFKCKVNLEKGVKELVQTYKKIELDSDTFNSRNYTRIKQIKYLKTTKQVDKELFWTN